MIAVSLAIPLTIKQKRAKEMEGDRPFLEHWDHLWQLEVRRKQGEFNGHGMDMVMQFVHDIGYSEFLKHAKRTTALLEIARFYENKFDTEADVVSLI